MPFVVEFFRNPWSFAPLLAWRERFSRLERNRLWLTALLVGLFAWALATFLAAPPLWFIKEGSFLQGRDATLLSLSQHPLRRDLLEPILAYRLTTPLLAYLLHLPGYWPLAVQYVALVAFFAVVFVAVRRRANGQTALLGVLLTAQSFATVWVNTKPGFPDSVTHLAAALCLLSARPIVVLPAALFGAFNDERLILAVPFIILWHVSARKDLLPEGRLLRMLRRAAPLLCALAAGLGLWLLGRQALKVGWIGPGVAPGIYREAGFYSPLNFFRGSFMLFFIANIFLSWRWAWWLPLAALRPRPGGVALWQKGAFALFLFGGVFASGIVSDVSRSIGFMFPAFLLAIVWLHAEGADTLRPLAYTVIACAVTPVGYFAGTHFSWCRPLPLALWRYWKA